MNTLPLFIIQFLWFLIAWAVIAKIFVLPMTKGLEQNDKLLVWLSPQLFRVLGLGLLVENLAPSLPISFSLPTAIGDCLTSVLALISIIALHQKWVLAQKLALTCNIIGSLDLAIALPHAAVIGAAKFLTVQWYVPVLVVPLMIICHIMTFRVFFRQQS